MDSRIKVKRTRPLRKKGGVRDGSILPCCIFDHRNLFPCTVIFNDYQGLVLSWDLIFLVFTLHNLDVIDGTAFLAVSYKMCSGSYPCTIALVKVWAEIFLHFISWWGDLSLTWFSTWERGSQILPKVQRIFYS